MLPVHRSRLSPPVTNSPLCSSEPGESTRGYLVSAIVRRRFEVVTLHHRCQAPGPHILQGLFFFLISFASPVTFCR